VGCQTREDLSVLDGALVRLVLGPDGAVAVDAGAGGFGRGAYVHPRASCLASAVVRGLPRAAKSSVHLAESDAASGAPSDGPARLSAAALAQAIVTAVDRRIHGLLISAARCRALALGADAAAGAGKRGEAKLIVVAWDASAAAELGEVRRAVSEGRAVAWGTKLTLASAIGRADRRTTGVGVVAVTSDHLAAALRAAVHVRDACRSIAQSLPPNPQGPAGPLGPIGRSHGAEIQGAESAGERSRVERSA
jgi:predicted RNA-binding protein YlxR (DUF448 family)